MASHSSKPLPAPARPRERRVRLATAITIAGLALSRGATAEPSLQRSFVYLLEEGRAPATFRLGLISPEAMEIRPDDVQAAAEAVPAEPPKPRKFWIGVVTAATLVGSAYNSFGDGPSEKFHFTSEEWFGKNTYAGGGDKASHFVSFYVVARMLTGVYGALGVSTDSSRLMGSGASFLAGLVTELGDGQNRYGFSYEDLVVDALGTASALAIAHYGLEDLIGFRAGLVPAPPNDPSNPYRGIGKDYTQEIYSGDLKIAGLAKRLRFRPGPARFLLLSTTYSAKGYPYAAPDLRERQIGIEIGLNLSEILRATGVPDRSWWRVLYFIFDSIRFPYTSIGYQFDLNHKKWRGPSIGDSFSGGGS